ncbi:hypothetical protein ACB098_01G343700 [Castanea mollissima]
MLKIFWGIVPVRSFSPNSKLCRFWRRHKSLGMPPFTLFASMPNTCNIDKLLMIGGIFPVKLLPPRYSTSRFSELPKPFGILPLNLLYDRDKIESSVQLLNCEVSLPLNSFSEIYSPRRLGHWVQRFIGRVPEK